MAVMTQVVWPAGARAGDGAVLREGDIRAAEQTQPYESVTDPVTGIITTKRWWVDLECAESWIEFIGTMVPPCTEASIFPE